MEIFPIAGIPEITKGDDLAEIIIRRTEINQTPLLHGDILVIAQKVVSKAEGCVYKKSEIEVTAFAKQICSYTEHEPEYMELVLRGCRRIVRMANGLAITQTHHGFVMANSGVDSSNSGGEDRIVALPRDPDASARGIKQTIEAYTGSEIAVIISDTFGRPWRSGQVNMAIGLAGIKPIKDYRGTEDNDGRVLKATQIAVVDELASAAELVSGKSDKQPVVVIRGFEYEAGSGTARELVRDEVHDIFK